MTSHLWREMNSSAGWRTLNRIRLGIVASVGRRRNWKKFSVDHVVGPDAHIANELARNFRRQRITRITAPVVALSSITLLSVPVPPP